MAAQKQNSCIGKNSFLESMSKAKPFSVEISTSPVFGQMGHCGHEWSKHGNCCDVHDLTAYANLEQHLVTISRRQLNKAVFQLKHEVSKHLKRSHKSTLTTLAHLATFTANSDTCWDYMVKIRKSALCAACSGRSESFFTGSKILIEPTTCSTAVSSCAAFYRSLASVRNILPEFIANSNEKDKAKLKDLNGDLIMYGPTPQLLQAFADYDVKKSKGFSRAEAKICSMIVNVMKPPFILQVNIEGAKAYKLAMVSQAQRRHGRVRDSLKKSKDQELTATKTKHFAAIAAEEVTFKAKIDALNRSKSKSRKDAIKREKSIHKDTLKFLERSNKNNVQNIQRKYEKLEKEYHNHYIEKKKDAQKYSDSTAKNWTDKAKESAKSKGRKLSSSKGDSRKLTLFPIENFFEADSSVFIKKSDSLFASFDGAPGTTLEVETGVFRSMNLSLTFP